MAEVNCPPDETFFCAQLNNCTLNEIGDVTYDNLSGCTQLLQMNQNGIVGLVDEPRGFLTATYQGAPIVHPANFTSVQIPFDTLNENDFCTFTPDGLSIEITQTGMYDGRGALFVSDVGDMGGATDHLNVQLSFILSGAMVGEPLRQTHTWDSWEEGANPFMAMHANFANRTTILAGTRISAFVLAKDNPPSPFFLQQVTIQLWRFAICPCP